MSFELPQSARMERIMEGRAQRPQERILGRTIMDGRVERPQDASFHWNQSIHHLHRRRPLRQWYKGERLVRYEGLVLFQTTTQLDQVHRLESRWQPYYMKAYKNELETVDELQHLGKFGMKPPY